MKPLKPNPYTYAGSLRRAGAWEKQPSESQEIDRHSHAYALPLPGVVRVDDVPLDAAMLGYVIADPADEAKARIVFSAGKLLHDGQAYAAEYKESRSLRLEIFRQAESGDAVDEGVGIHTEPGNGIEVIPGSLNR